MTRDLPASRWPELILRATGGICSALGLIVLVGWIGHLPFLIQISPSFVPMHFNTASGILVCGIGILSIFRGRKEMALLGGGLASLLGLLTLLQYILNADLGIDQLFIKDYYFVAASYPGRMPPNVALSIALAGSSILLMSKPKSFRQRPLILGLWGSIIIGLGAVTLFNYITGMSIDPAFTRLPVMAVHTAVGLVSAGIGIIAFSWVDGKETGAPRWLLIYVGIVTATLWLWQALMVQGRADLDRKLRAEEASQKLEIETQFRAQVQSLQRMAQRWEKRGMPNQNVWDREGSQYVARAIGVQYLDWVDSSFQVLRTAPANRNKNLQPSGATFATLRESTLETAKSRSAVSVSHVFDFPDGNKGFLAVLPIVNDGTTIGYILGVVRIQDLLDTITRKLPTDLSLTVFDADMPIYTRYPSKLSYQMEWGRESTIDFYGVSWRVRVSPSETLVERTRTPIIESALVLGLLIVSLLAVESTIRKLEGDITRRKHVEHELQVEKAYLQQLFQTAPEAVVVVSNDSKILRANSEFTRMFGYTVNEVEGRSIDELLAPGNRLNEALSITKQVADGNTISFESVRKRKDGTLIDVSILGTPIKVDGGQIAIYGIYRDITERRRTEEEMTKLVYALKSVSESVAITDMEDRILFVNDAFLKTYGYGREELTGRKIELIRAESNLPTVTQEIRPATLKGGWQGELVNRRKDGTEFPVYLSTSTVRDERGNAVGLISVVTDITEKKKMEAQLLRTQRMESIGTLAGGIAHDLNNILAPILISIRFLKKRIGDDQTQQILGALESSARRGTDMVSQVLTFARGMEGKRLVMQPAHLVKEMEKIVREVFPRTIEIRAETQKDLWTVWGDPTQLHQVLMNLCINARDAMPDGGTLTITAENVEVDQNSARMYPDGKPGRHVVLTVSDTGTGIPDELREKIFEPFFTTKQIGKGTGLGLSTVLGIVRSHGGFVSVTSDGGKGSQFRVHLPAVKKPESRKTDERSAELPMGRGETILVVDDEASICDIIRATLESCGYKVLTANDRTQAIAIYTARKARVDVVLTDMIMPSAQGISAVQAFREIDPSVKIVAMSGDSSVESLNDVSKTGLDMFIAKPFTAELLLKTLHEVLSEKKPQ